jgi:hypothetical protein
MKYLDNGGDTWEDADDGRVRVVVLSGDPVTDGQPCLREHAEEKWGPLVPVSEGAGLPLVSDVMDRATVFQSAHALVSGLKWGEEAPSVYDVLNVAKWLEGEA